MTESERLEHIRQCERERLRALVIGDIDAARRLHADDFELINPAGQPLSKEEYLGAIESGQLRYHAWDPGAIVVRLHGRMAVIRYRDLRFEVDVGGQPLHRGPMYHTNVFELRDSRWQVVWSQASGIISL
jgi:hypothetical protein